MSMLMKKSITVVLLSVCMSGLAVAGLAERINKILEPKKDGDHSIQVVEPESGATIYSYDARNALIPASNVKLVTTAAALRYLGPDFEYETKVGFCEATLVVIGSGDPLFGDEETDARYERQDGWILESITEALRREGIDEINDVIVDTTIFDDERVHPNWPANDLNKWYACEVCGLNYNVNCIEVTTNNVGGAVAVAVEPQTSFVEIINEVKPISGGAGAVGSYRNRQPNKITVFGKCRDQQGPFKVAIEQPAAFFGYLLAERLVRAGIVARGRFIEKGLPDDCDFRPLVKFTTPMADVLARANTDSLGLAAEALLKTIAAHADPDGGSGSWAEGRDLLAQYLSDLGIDADEFKIDDGSGLSRDNRLTAHAITTVLLDLYRSKNWERYRSSLAIGGETGTIARYFKEPKYRAHVLGKTGYIRGVRSFSGICLTESGPYLFSIISNGSKGLSRDEINDIAETIIDEYEVDD